MNEKKKIGSQLFSFFGLCTHMNFFFDWPKESYAIAQFETEDPDSSSGINFDEQMSKNNVREREPTQDLKRKRAPKKSKEIAKKFESEWRFLEI